jgi:hypothetical protein
LGKAGEAYFLEEVVDETPFLDDVPNSPITSPVLSGNILPASPLVLGMNPYRRDGAYQDL